MRLIALGTETDWRISLRRVGKLSVFSCGELGSSCLRVPLRGGMLPSAERPSKGIYLMGNGSI